MDDDPNTPPREDEPVPSVTPETAHHTSTEVSSEDSVDPDRLASSRFAVYNETWEPGEPANQTRC